jgi:hypothetical protein
MYGLRTGECVERRLFHLTRYRRARLPAGSGRIADQWRLAMNWNWVEGVALLAFNVLVVLIWKPWAGAYAGEKGKNLARKEDLEAIVAEIRAVTMTQKEIEAKISGDMWDRQWRLDKKLDAYGRILRAISDYMVWLADYSDDVKFRTGKTTTKTPATIAEEFYSAYALSALLLSAESIAIVEKIKPEFFYHSSLRYQNDTDGDAADTVNETLGNEREALIASARRDIG